MATTRPFSYNTGPTISGTTQVGNLAVGTPVSGFTGMEWWNGPDEDLGYVIAQSVSGDTQPTPISGVTASVGFFRTSGFNNNEFVNIANILLNENYNNVLDASTGLTYNGYWSSYTNPIIGCGSLVFSLIPPSGYTADQSLIVPVSGVLDLTTTTTFTVESWVYPTSSLGDQITVFGDTQGYTKWWSLSFNTNNNTLLFYWIDNLGGKEITGYDVSQTIPLSGWTHMAVSVNSGTTKMFINGTELGLTGDVIPFIGTAASTSQLQVGNWVNNGTNRFNLKGNLSNLRVNNTTALYTSSFTPLYPLTSISGTSLLLLTDGNSPTSDSSGNDVSVVNSGGITWEEKCVTLPTPTPTPTSTVTPTPTNTPTPTPTPTPTNTPTPTPTPTSGRTFSQAFTGGTAPSSAIETAWNVFRTGLTGSYTTFTISSTNGSSVTVTDSTLVQTLANALRNATNNTSVTIGGVVWRVGTGCGVPKIGGVAVEFSNIASCSGSSTIALRPMINNLNWGGIGTGSTVGQASQTITLTFS